MACTYSHSTSPACRNNWGSCSATASKMDTGLSIHDASLIPPNALSNPDLFRIALKLATGAGKTTVMAMLIAWQTVNAVRHPGSRQFTRGFLIVAPGLTIKDRLRVLLPQDPESYYQSREIVPGDMLGDIKRAVIVITNYHAFKLRETLEISAAGRSLLQGRGAPIQTLETEGQMLQRVMPELMGLKNLLVINDEAHHCYRARPQEAQGQIDDLKGDDKDEAKKNNEAARLWISGIEAVKRKLGVPTVFDLSATPFFLRGSGHAEGTPFPWTMCGFSLMDAIECGNAQAAARAGGRQHHRRGRAEIPRPVAAHRQAHAEEGRAPCRQAGPAGPAHRAVYRAGSAARPLCPRLRQLAGAGFRSAHDIEADFARLVEAALECAP